MKILFTCKELPHSRIIGGPIIVYNRIKYLSRKHTVSLAAFYHPGEEKYASSLIPFCHELKLIPFPLPRSVFKTAWDIVFSPLPHYFLKNHGSEEMRCTLAEMVRREKYDFVIAEYSVMGQFVYKNPWLPPVRKVISVHECYYLARLKSFRLHKPGKAKLEEALNLMGLKKYEFGIYRDADKVLTLTPQGKEELLSIAPDLDVSVVPHGVDVNAFSFTPRAEEEKCVVFVGNYLHYPNVDAVLYFHHQIWPLLKKYVPEIKFYVVGQSPPEEIRKLARDKSIIVTGTVEDVVPYLRKAEIFVNPVRLGGGFRGKILEAMSLGRPVVSTSLGAEGIPASSRENIIIADTPGDFAQGVAELINDKELYLKIQKNARHLMEEKYAWEKGAALLEKILEEMMQHPPEGKRKRRKP